VETIDVTDEALEAVAEAAPQAEVPAAEAWPIRPARRPSVLSFIGTWCPCPGVDLAPCEWR
jgi:hypothetical protein